MKYVQKLVLDTKFLFIRIFKIKILIYVQKNVDLNNLETLDDEQVCILFYNYAVLLHFEQQYSSSFDIIEKLYHEYSEYNLLDINLCQKINILYLELLIILRRVN